MRKSLRQKCSLAHRASFPLKKSPELDDDSGQVSAKVIILGAFARIALTATVWITSTTAGVSADTAKCISSVDVGCSNRNGRVADAGRQNTAAGVGAGVSNFGSQSSSTSRTEALKNANDKVSKEDLPGVLESMQRIVDLPITARPYSQDWLFYDSNNVYSDPNATKDTMVNALKKEIGNAEKNLNNLRFPWVSSGELNKIEELLDQSGKNTAYVRVDSKGNTYRYTVSDLMRAQASTTVQRQAIADAQALVDSSSSMSAAEFKTAFGDLQKKHLVIGGEAGVWKSAMENLQSFGNTLE